MLKYNPSLSTVILVCLTLSGCALSRDINQIEAYNQFAIKAAQAQLWNEAVFRWKQVIAVDPENAKAYNNLGVAYEAIGNIDEAVDAYEHATALDPDNKYYRLNYRRCRIHIRRSGADNADTSEQKEEETPDTESEEGESTHIE